MVSGGLSQSNSLRRRSISAGTWSLGALIAAQGIRLGGNLIMARLLLPEMFGIMTIATTFAVVIALLSDIGLHQNIVQSKRGSDPAFLNTAWTVQILRGLLLFAVALLISALAWFAQTISFWSADSVYAAPELPLVLAVTGVSALIFGFQSTKVALAYRTFQQKKVVIAELIAQVVALLVMLGIGYFTRSIWSLVISGLVATSVATVLGHLWFQGPRNRLQWEHSALRELINFGRWILLSSIVGVLAVHGDRIWFSGVMSASELGIYSIAVLLLGAIETAVRKLAGAVALPAFSEAARGEDAARLRYLYYRFRLIVDVVLLFVCGFLLTASPLIISWMYDERYADAGNMLAILSLSFFTLRFTLAHQVWLAMGLTKYQAMDNVVRFVSLWGLLALLLAIGSVEYAVWGVALHALPTLVLVFYINCRLGLFSIIREVVVLPMLGAGFLFGMLLTKLFSLF